MAYLRILAGDIGATNSRFALFGAETDSFGAPVLGLERERWLKGADYPSFSHALKALRSPGAGHEAALFEQGPEHSGPGAPLARQGDGRRPALAVLALAGPIQGDGDDAFCRISNLPWLITAREVKAELGLDAVFLINDFAAQAYACLMPEQMDAAPVLSGTALADAPVAVAGAGTGFGKALLIFERNGGAAASETSPGNSGNEFFRRLACARVLPSEGGHVDFPFIGKEEWDFALFAGARRGGRRLIGDAVVSGSGLADLYAFHTGQDLHPHEATAKAGEQPRVLEWFARFYGRICRNYVLETLALGGLYITGGMALRVPVLSHPAFAREFYTSASQEQLLRNTPVWHIRKAQAGLWGAALYGLRHTRQKLS
ncbi:glucokinase [Desulfovibrio sp. OttesenSCG-928-A18]|nr:glucokinase [Desulfovibrio sp. OttesenSCG-928-A18]